MVWQFECIGLRRCIGRLRQLRDGQDGATKRGLVRYTSERALEGGTTRWLPPAPWLAMRHADADDRPCLFPSPDRERPLMSLDGDARDRTSVP